jgi:hypothetical protein
MAVEWGAMWRDRFSSAMFGFFNMWRLTKLTPAEHFLIVPNQLLLLVSENPIDFEFMSGY